MLKIILSAWLFTNVFEINQQYKQKTKIMFDKSLEVICCLYKLKDFEASIDPSF